MKYLISFLSLLFICNLGLAQWKTLKTFRGSGVENTEKFTMNYSEWKIYYFSQVSPGETTQLFQVYLLELGQELWQGELVVNQGNKKTIEGETYIYKSGTFYFKSNSMFGDWEVRVMVPVSKKEKLDPGPHSSRSAQFQVRTVPGPHSNWFDR